MEGPRQGNSYDFFAFVQRAQYYSAIIFPSRALLNHRFRATEKTTEISASRFSFASADF